MAGGAAFTNPQLIKAAETLVLSSGKCQLAYRDWINLPALQKTFNNFPTPFLQEYQIKNEMQATTAQQQGFAGHVDKVQATQALEEVVTNFAEASAAD